MENDAVFHADHSISSFMSALISPPIPFVVSFALPPLLLFHLFSSRASHFFFFYSTWHAFHFHSFPASISSFSVCLHMHSSRCPVAVHKFSFFLVRYQLEALISHAKQNHCFFVWRQHSFRIGQIIEQDFVWANSF
jgi:hypothetical protein